MFIISIFVTDYILFVIVSIAGYVDLDVSGSAHSLAMSLMTSYVINYFPPHSKLNSKRKMVIKLSDKSREQMRDVWS